MRLPTPASLVAAILLAVGCGGAEIVDTTRAADAPAATSEQRARLRVRVERVRLGSIGDLAGVAGEMSAFRTTTVASEVGARVVERHVEPGARVATGDPLVTVDDTLMRIAVDEASATLRMRSVDLEEAVEELTRGDELRREGTISKRQHDAVRFSRDRAKSARDLADAALRRARRALSDTVVRAPFDGTVEDVGVQVGDFVAAGAPVAMLADLSRVRVRAGVTGAEAAQLEPGRAARVTVAALGDYETQATIHSVGRLADPSSGTYPVEFWIDNADGRLRGGMVAQVAIASGDATPALLVPRAALVRRDDGLGVFRVDGSGSALRAVAVPIRTGRQTGDHVEVLSGISEGDAVVVEGLFALRDGVHVEVDAGTEGGFAWSD